MKTAAKLHFTFAVPYNKSMIRLILLYLCIIIMTVFIQIILNVGFGKAVVMTYTTAALIMLASSYLGKLSYFKFLLAALLVFLTVLSFFFARKRGIGVADILRNSISPAFVMYSAAFIYLYAVMQTKGFTQIDDFFRWSPKVQEALRLDALYTKTEYSYINPNFYPPLTTLVSVFFNKMLGGFSESTSLFAMGSFCFALLLPYSDRLKWSFMDAVKALLQFLTIVALLLSVNLNPTMNGQVFVFNTTYPDWITGLMIAYGFLLILWFNNTASDYVTFCFLNTALLLTDRICIAFSLLLVVTFFMRLLIKSELNKKRILAYAVSALVVPLFIYFSWRVYLSTFAPNLLFYISAPVSKSAAVSESTVLQSAGLFSAIALRSRFFFLELAGYQKQIFADFVRFFFTEPVYIHPFRISFFAFLMIFLVAMIAVFFAFGRKEKQIPVVAVFYVLGGIAYAATLCYTYMFSFSYEEAISLAVYGRYMQSYTIAGLVLLIYTALSYIKHNAMSVLALLLAVCFFEPVSAETIMPTPGKEKYKEKERTVIKNYVDTEYSEEPTLIVDSKDICYYYLIRSLYAEKARNVSLYQDTSSSTADEFAEKCENKEFVLIGEAGTYFIDNIWEKLSDTPCYNSTLYRIIHEENTIRFEMVYSFEAMAEEIK